MAEEKGKKVDVTDIEKLRPELLGVALPNLERRRAEIDMSIVSKGEIEAGERRKADLKRAETAFDNMMNAIQELQGLGPLPDRIKNALTSDDRAIPADDVETLSYNLGSALPGPLAALAVKILQLITPRRKGEVEAA